MRSRLRRLAVAGLVLALACIGGFYGWDWWTTARDRESTDNAYVRGDITAVGPKVAGYVAEVPVDDNQTVDAGTVLVRIDDSDFRAQVDREIGRAHVCTPVTNAHLVCRLLLEKKK